MSYKIRLPKAVRTSTRQNVTILNRDQASALLTEPVLGFSLKDWIAQRRDVSLKSLNAVVREGLRNGDTLDQLSTRIGQSIEGAKRHAGTLARTAVNQAAANVAEETYSQNPELVSKYRYVAILDNRTSARCRSLDGKEFLFSEKNAPRPPQHFNCRSKIRPVIDWEEIGMEPMEIKRKAVGDERDTVGSEEDYESWLHQQSPEFQEEVIGDPDKLRWFQEGKVSLGDLVNSDGRERTLDELQRVLLDKHFPDLSGNEDEIKRFERLFNPQIKTLTKQEIAAIHDYQGMGKVGFDNRLLWDYNYRETMATDKPKEYSRQMALKRRLDSVFKKTELPESVTAHRGMSHPELARMIKASPDDLVGTKIKFDNYVSTSIEENEAFVASSKAPDWIQMEIQAPKEAQALYIGHPKVGHKTFAFQKELLFNRGSSFRVKKAWIDDTGVKHVVMEYIK